MRLDHLLSKEIRSHVDSVFGEAYLKNTDLKVLIRTRDIFINFGLMLNYD